MKITIDLPVDCTTDGEWTWERIARNQYHLCIFIERVGEAMPDPIKMKVR